MKNINEISIGQNTDLSNDVNESKKLIRDAVTDLFKQIEIIKPAAMAQIDKQTRNDADYRSRLMRMWMRELFDEQITPDEITNALRHLKRDSSNFMPSIGQFMHWCREPLNMSEIDALYDEYINRGKPVYKNAIIPSTGQTVKTETHREWSNGVIEEINRRLGLPHYLAGTLDDQKKRFYETYKQVMKEHKVKPFKKTPVIENKNKVGNYEERKENIVKSKGYEEFKKLRGVKI